MHRSVCHVLVHVPVLLPLILACAASCGPQSAAAPEHEEEERAPTSKTVLGEQLLLFLEYPHLVQGVPARFLAHLSVRATGEPVRGGTVVLEIGASRWEVDAAKREGLFIPEGALTDPGTFPGRLVVTSDQGEETLDLGTIVVHPIEEAADDAARAEAGSEPAGAVPFLLEQQWKVKLLVAEAGSRTLEERLDIPARAVPMEGRSAIVSPPMGGRLVAPPSGALPRTGERVEAGAVLALVEPPLGAPELAELHALELELDLRSLDVARASGEAEARLRFAEREHERIGKLRAEGLGTEQQLGQAEQALAVARTELEAAERGKESLDRLVASRDAARGSETGGPLRFELAAPIAGIVVDVRGVPGAAVEPGEPVFRILDASRVWVEGRVSEFDLPRVGEAPRATAEFAALPGRSYELLGVHDGKPWIGPEVDASSRTLLLRYELENADGAVRPGMLAELHVATGRREARVAIPSESVVMDQGLPVAYVMLEGELFQKRDLELGMRDGDFVEVVRGVEPGERVATRGAYVIRLAALTPASFGPGHAH